MMGEFQLLVAGRKGTFSAPESWGGRIHALDVAEDLDHVSSTEVRERIARGEAWEHLVPEAVVEMARAIYG
jgi:nicotinic acid mononucleotide adenylyltransferase